MRFISLWLLLFTLLAALSGCGMFADPAPPLRVGVDTQWPGNAPFYVAAHEELYAPTPIKVITLPSLDDTYRAFKERRIDVAVMTLFDVLPLAAAGVPINIVLVADYSNGADGIVARADIATARDLKGQRVGIMRNSFNHFLLLAALDQVGLQEEDVELVDLTLENAARAFEQGDLDAAALWDPMLSEQASKNGAHKIFTSADVPGLIVDVVVVHQDVVAQRPADVVGLIAGWDKALQSWQSQPDQFIRITAETMQLPPEQIPSSLAGVELPGLDGNRQLFDPTSEQSLWKTYAAVASFMAKYQLLDQAAPAAETIINPQFVEASATR